MSASSLLRIGILISGAGSNMLSIAEAIREREIAAELALVATDKPECIGLMHAASLGIPTFVIPKAKVETRESYDARLRVTLESQSIELVVLAGYMRILSNAFVNAFSGRLINIHPSLLPNHKGLHTHRRVLAAGDTVHGASVHYVTPELDGGPVILQASFNVRTSDDEKSLATRTQIYEHKIYPKVVKWIASGRLKYIHKQAQLDGHILTQPIIEYFT